MTSNSRSMAKSTRSPLSGSATHLGQNSTQQNEHEYTKKRQDHMMNELEERLKKEFQCKFDNLHEDFKRTKKEVEIISDELKRKGDELEAVRCEIEKLKMEIEELKEVKSQLLKERDQLRKSLEEKDSSLKTSENDKDVLKKQLELKDKEIEKNEKDLKTMQILLYKSDNKLRYLREQMTTMMHCIDDPEQKTAKTGNDTEMKEAQVAK